MSDGFWVRLKQRKLVQWALAYVAAAFAFVQVLDVVAQRFGWPDRIEKLIILALAIGFFVALVLAWYHGERGAQRVGGTELVIIALLLAIGGGALWIYARSPQATVQPAVAAVPKPPVPQAAAASVPVPSPESIPAKSVAVLPFANEGEKSEQFFSDGLSEDLITALSQFSGLKVISRNSAFQFRDSKDTSAEIGKLLGVAHLLEGSVQRAGDEVRITATLVNAADGTVLWTQRYDKPYKDLFALQDAITHSVADALKAKLLTAPGAVVQSDRPPSGNLDAYTAYLRGISGYSLGTEASLRAAITDFEKAVHLDPRYAAAYAQLSRAWASLAGQYLYSAEAQRAYTEARVAADTALKLDTDSSLAHHARAYLLQNADMDWRRAEAEYRRALQLAPDDAYAKTSLGNILATLGQTQRAVDLTRQALDSNPRNANWYSWLATYLAALDKLDGATQAANTSVALQPDAVAYHEQLAIIEILRGDAKGALAAAQKEPPSVWHDYAMALALQIGSDRKAADAALKNLIAKNADGAPYQIAEVYALRRDPDNMFKWLDHAWKVRDPGISNLLFDPFILRYRDDPRFAAFCKKVGLPTTTDAVAMR
ncbi:MAG: Adenylate cyclase [Rhodanobacteraceae bacterium]|nr:MAG: Adenylate cyclase [Rhodanobacteraceae bacterium]